MAELYQPRDLYHYVGGEGGSLIESAILGYVEAAVEGRLEDGILDLRIYDEVFIDGVLAYLMDDHGIRAEVLGGGRFRPFKSDDSQE
ncbi:MAG: hypothetical protein ISS48_00950 [Candidatus Aenigmarchaeota archaeon]|nr:hypothetical protein [Candidatus Aenigmarchaeota archaeon]